MRLVTSAASLMYSKPPGIFVQKRSVLFSFGLVTTDRHELKQIGKSALQLTARGHVFVMRLS